MGNQRLDVLQGTLDLLVLRAVRNGALHGYGISEWIRERTKGEISLVDAALYKALHRLERDEYVESSWGASENNRRARYYRLTTLGRKKLREELSGWRRYAAAVERIVGES